MLKVLIADDEKAIKKSMRALIETELEGLEVVAEAKNGIEALQSIELYAPNIVITDIRMPGMDGLEMIQKIGARYPRIHFIIVSGYDDFSFAQQALRCGVTDYLLKPIDSDYFLSVLGHVKQHLQSQSAQARHADEKSSIRSVHSNPESAAAIHPMTKEVLSYMEQMYRDPAFSLMQAALHFKISPNYFSSLLKSAIGMSFIQYLNFLRLEQAKVLLQDPFMKVYEVGLSVGYEDYAHFSKMFKKSNGCSPSEYRNDSPQSGQTLQ